MASIPANQLFVVTEVVDGFGKVTYNGTTGWVNLNYCTYVEPIVTKPVAPTVMLKTAPDIPITGLATVEWNSVYDAKYYSAVVYDQGGNEKQRTDNIYGTTASFCLRDPGDYTIKVYGKNSLYTGDPGTANSVVHVHANSTVTFLDWDGRTIGLRKPYYNESVTAPLAPERIGYTFQNWSGGSMNNIREDKTFTATYAKNEYMVQFYDYEGNKDGAVQRVAYLDSAVPPTPRERENYEFVAWDSDKWQNVYTENKNEVIEIRPIYRWTNQELPIEVSGTSAEREENGYTVHYTLQNHAELTKSLRGRVVVCLKSDSDKLLWMSESSAFSMKPNAVKTDEIFIPYQKAASKVDLLVISDYANNVPISRKVTINEIDGSLMWSDWSVIQPAQMEGTEINARKEYRYDLMQKEWFSASTKSGWEKTGGRRITNNPVWSNWSDSPVSAYSDPFGVNNPVFVREVNTREVDLYSSKTKYDYFHHYNSNTGRWSPVQYSGFGDAHRISLDYTLSWKGDSSVSGWSHYGTAGCPYCGGQNYWYPNGSHTESVKSGTKPQYSYRDTYYQNEFWRWPGNWSAWSEEPVYGSSTRRVEERTVYRYRSNGPEVTTVDDSGTPRTFSYTFDPVFAGKQATIFITKYKAASDFTNEYIGQTVIGADGTINLNYKLREEPSAETGDMTIFAGIEGNTEMLTIGVIEAPKPTYTVQYVNEDGTPIPEIPQRQVAEGNNVEAPTYVPEKPGYTFAGWNNTGTNVHSDLEIRPIFVEDTYTVFFVDYRNPENTHMRSFHYGDPIVPEEGKELTDVDSGYARTWDTSGAETTEDGTAIVTGDMIVTAVYETKTFDVVFVAFDEENELETLEKQTVEYEGVATMPELEDTEDVTYLGWDIENEDLMNVTDSFIVTPIFVYNETTAEPQISLESGAYTGTQTVTLSCETEDAVIYYTLDGSDPQENPLAIEYTDPFTVSETAMLNCFAGSLGRNDSEVETAYYVLNGNGAIVHVHSDLYPEESETDTFLVTDMSEIDTAYFDVDGQTLTGVYTDAAHTQTAVLTGAPTDTEIDLYLEYEANMYTVTFLDMNGNTVKTAQVLYGESVEPPEMEKIGTTVCTGWEGGDFDYVTTDTTLHPIYKEESEIVNITLSRSKFEVAQGSFFKLNAAVTPEDKANLEVIWISENDTIASVTEDGTVTANAPGTVKIYAVTEDDSAQSFCEVTVTRSPNYSLCLKETATMGLDTAGNLRGAPVYGNTVDFIASQFRNDAATLCFKNANEEILTGSDLVGTGATVSLMDGDTVLDTWTVVHTGDITCDGRVDNQDVSFMLRFVAKKETFDEYQCVAADVNGDGKLNLRDASYLMRALVGKETL